MNNKLVSVCINCYNAENTIAATVRSVLDQTYTNLQVIVVDDCSTDSTYDILCSFTDERLIVHRLAENGHISNANNTALRLATGDYIAHTDADDIWFADKLEKQVAFLESHSEYGACFSLARMVDECGNVLDDRRFRAENLPQAAMLHYLLTKGNFILHSSMLARKEIVDRVGEHDPTLLYFHDYDYWVRMATVCAMYILPEELLTYRVATGSNSDMTPEKYQAHVNEFARIAYDRIVSCPDELFLQAFADELRFHGEHTAIHTALEKAFLLTQSLVYLPRNSALGMRRLDELMRDPVYRACAKADFGFGVHELYALHQQTVYHNADECERDKATIVHQNNLYALLEQEKQAMAAHYEAQYAALGASHAEAMRQLTLMSQSRSWKITAPLRLFNTARRINKAARKPHLKDGRSAACKIVMYGYFGRNLGDDLFFDMLFTRYPDTVFAVYDANNYEAFFARYPNVYSYPKTDARVQKVDAYGAKLRCTEAFEKLLLSKADAVVHIGGSIYQQIGTWQEDLRLREKRTKRRRPFFSISSNFGPFTTDEYRQFWQKKFKDSHDICFRDTYSYDLFSSIKAVRYAPDLLFSLPLPSVETVNDQLFISVLNPLFTGLDFTEEQAATYTANMAAIAQRHLEQGHRVCLSSFCAFTNDEATINAIVQAIPAPLTERLTVVNYNGDGNFTPLLTAIAQSEYVLATRFHAMLLGLSAGIKTLPICYNQKMTNVLSDMQFNGAVHDINSFLALSADDVLAQLKAQPLFDATAIRQQAAMQFDRLDAFVRRKGGRVDK